MIRLKTATITNPSSSLYDKSVTAGAQITYTCDSTEEQDLVMARLQPMWADIALAMAKALAPGPDRGP